MTIKMCMFVRQEDGTSKCSECGLVAPEHAANPTAVCGNKIPPPAQRPVYIARRDACSPGTELKKLLSVAGIVATASCSCNQKARLMDEWGCDLSEQRIEEIVGWLRDEASRRKLPFIDAAGRMLVRRAIRNARRACAKKDT